MRKIEFDESKDIKIIVPIEDLAEDKLMKVVRRKGIIHIQTTFGMIVIHENINVNDMIHKYLIELLKKQ